MKQWNDENADPLCSFLWKRVFLACATSDPCLTHEANPSKVMSAHLQEPHLIPAIGIRLLCLPLHLVLNRCQESLQARRRTWNLHIYILTWRYKTSQRLQNVCLASANWTKQHNLYVAIAETEQLARFNVLAILLKRESKVLMWETRKHETAQMGKKKKEEEKRWYCDWISKSMDCN